MLTNKRKSILISLIVTIVVLSILAFSYAFISFDITGSEQTIRTSSAILELTYSECDNINNETCGQINKDLKIGESFSKAFFITNNSDVDVTTPLYFTKILNTFQNNELVYELKDLTSDRVVDSGPVPYRDQTSDQVLLTNLTIPANTRVDYLLTVTFICTSGDQNYNLDAEYYIEIGIE